MDLDLRLLRSFVAIYELGSLARASERLHCTAAALSMRLKLLEGEIGAPLFWRHATGMEPTARGSDLYARALGVLAVYDEMMSATRSRPARARVRIGLPDDYAMGWLAAALRGLGPRFDKVEVEVVCDLSSNLIARVQRQEIDIALATVATRPALARSSLTVPLRWIGQGADVVPLAAYPEGCVFRRNMIQTLEAAERGWRVAVQSSSRAGIISAVRSGQCVTAVAAGTAPPDVVEQVSTAFLPALPDVPVYLLGQANAPAMVARVESALLDAIGQTAVVGD